MEIQRLIQGAHYGRESWAKLAQAQKHLRTLEDSVSSWNSATEVEIEPEMSADGRSFSYVWSNFRRPPLDRWQLTAADIMHNLRDAFDRLNFQLSESLATSGFNERAISFPIVDDEKQWRDWQNRNGHIPGWLADRYREVQPMSNPPTPALRVLRELSNLEKHRKGISVVASFGEASVEGTFSIEGLPTKEELNAGISSAPDLPPVFDGPRPRLFTLHSDFPFKSDTPVVVKGKVSLYPRIESDPPMPLADVPDFIRALRSTLDSLVR